MPVLRKDHVGIATPGGRLSYLLFWSNPCRDVVTGVVVEDELPNSVHFLRAASSGVVREEGGRVRIDVGDLVKGPAGYARIDVEVDETLPTGSTLRNTAVLTDGFGRSVRAADEVVLRSWGQGRIQCAFRAQVYARPGSPIRYVVRYKNGGGNNKVTVSLPPDHLEIHGFSQPPDVLAGTLFQFARLARTAGSVRIDAAVKPSAPDGARLFSWASLEDEAGNVTLCEHRSQVRAVDRFGLFLHGTSKIVAGGHGMFTARYSGVVEQNELRVVVPMGLEVLSTFPAAALVEDRTWVFRDLRAPNGVVKLRVRPAPEAGSGPVMVGASLTDATGRVTSSAAESTVVVR